MKQTIPEPPGSEPEKWRAWKRDLLGYLDSITKGMEEFMTEEELADTDVDSTWLQNRSLHYGTWAINDKESIWRALSGLTKDDPKKLLEAVQEDGWMCWRRNC